MTPRDPKTDPRPGDVLESGGYKRTVTRRDGDTVYYKAPTSTRDQHCPVKTWAKFVDGSKVVNLANE